MTQDNILQNPAHLTRFVWVDNAGITRGKAATKHALAGALRSGVGMTVGQQSLPMMFDAVIPETSLGAVGEVRLMGDLETFTRLPHAPNHAMILSDMMTLEGRPWAHCPRDFLKRQLAAAHEMGLEIISSFENEFYLFRDDQPLDRSNYAVLDSYEVSRFVIDEMIEALAAAGLTPEMYYPEAGTGQQEISITPGVGLAGADRQVIFKAIIKGLAMKHGLRASFAAKPIESSAGSGCHLHLSFRRDGQNVFQDASDRLGLSGLAYNAIAGILEHQPGLCALTVPSVNSYRRLQPGWWAGAFSCYGLDNREASVRVLSSHLAPGGSGASTHFELKTCDASSNPYIALGGAIAAALDGIKRNLHPGPAFQDSPGSLSEAERARHRVGVGQGFIVGKKKERGFRALDHHGPALLRLFPTEFPILGILKSHAVGFECSRHGVRPWWWRSKSSLYSRHVERTGPWFRRQWNSVQEISPQRHRGHRKKNEHEKNRDAGRSFSKLSTPSVFSVSLW